MIALLAGKIVELEARAVIVDVNGVGYRVSVLGAFLATAKLDKEVKLKIYHQVSDSAETLYGFKTKRELSYFELLLTVPSIGPRTAMSILDIAPPDTLAQAVVNKDVKLLNKVSGVGKKTAERILIELAEKISETPSQSKVSGDIQEETVSALVALGFTQTQAQALLPKLPNDVKTVEQAVKFALKEK